MEEMTNLHTNGNGSDTAALFWQWFTRNEHRFRQLERNDSEQALAFLDELIGQMKPYNSWLKALAGPYGGDKYELIITADGDVALFCKVEELIAKAPELEQWKFTAHKPALGFEDISIDMYGKKFNVETTRFYPIISDDYPDEVSIILTHVDYDEAEDDQFQAGGMIFLENGLGELNTATKIDHYETGPLPDATSGAEVIPISKLADYLNWREKEFVEKYESVDVQRPEESYNVLEAEDGEGRMMLVAVDVGFKDWPRRPAYPWLFQVDINYEGDANGLPGNKQLEELQAIEQEIVRLLCVNPSIFFVGHRTYDNVRNVYFYASEYLIGSRLLHGYIEHTRSPYQIVFFVRKDKYWHNMELYFNATGED